MKKHRISIIILALLTLLAAFLVLRKTNGTLLKTNTAFAVTDTASITKFFLADKNNNIVKVERSGKGGWILNDKYEVNPTMVEVMLSTFSSIEVKAPVAKAARNTIIRLLAGKSVKTEIYQRVYRINLFNKIKFFPHEKLTRTYFVGDATMDNSGTFMLMQGSDDPCIVGIPGFRGFVATRYSSMESDWRSHSIFRYRVPDISSVSIQYNDSKANSFRINNLNNRLLTLTALDENRLIDRFDTAKAVEYLTKFRNLNYENILNEMSKTKKDSILASEPSIEISLVDKLGKAHTLKAWKRKADQGQLDMNGNATYWDQERLYGLVDDSEDMVSLQYFVFGGVFMPLSWFAITDSGSNEPGN